MKIMSSLSKKGCPLSGYKLIAHLNNKNFLSFLTEGKKPYIVTALSAYSLSGNNYSKMKQQLGEIM